MSAPSRQSKNSPCSCGSGKKFRKCHGAPTILGAMREQERQRQAAREKQEATFGKVRDIIHADFKGSKFVAVGRSVLFSHPKKPWRTFPDFLDSFLKGKFGAKWWQAERAKPPEKWHPLIHTESAWRAAIERAPGQPGGVVRANDGAVTEYALVCYDLYIASHHMLFSRSVLKRLRNAEQYPGARVELAAASTFLRAGFELEMEDEKDGSRKHPEFVAVDRRSGLRIDVEAKRRHRNDGDNGETLGIEHLVRAAVEKVSDKPFALFLELNAVPRDGRPLPQPWLNEISDALDNHARRFSPASPTGVADLFSMMIVSNRWHQPNVPADYRHTTVVPLHALRPLPRAAVEALLLAVRQSNRIPNDFPAE